MNARQDIGETADLAFAAALFRHTAATADDEALAIEAEDGYVEARRRELLTDEDSELAIELIADAWSGEFGNEPQAFIRLILRAAIARQRGAVESYQKACHELCQRVDDVFCAEARRQFERGAR